jgi:hypothetical protein
VPRQRFCITQVSRKENQNDYSWKKEDFPALPFGTASGVLRVNVTELIGGNFTCQAYLEY